MMTSSKIAFESEDALEVTGDGWTFRVEPGEDAGVYQATFCVQDGDESSNIKARVIGAESLGVAVANHQRFLRHVAGAYREFAALQIAFPSKPESEAPKRRWWKVWA
jgi:hypothetical protein